MWRKANVIPLYKGKGSKTRASSYRPISLTDVGCKLLKHLVAEQIRHFWSSKNLPCAEQHGFIPHQSTVSNLIACDSIVANYMNKHHACDVILLDITRAFNKVPYSAIKQKLANLGIVAHLVDWVTNFLNERTQLVTHGGAASTLVFVTSGEIQGSVVGPLLFDVFINDMLEQVITYDIILYADDVKAVGVSADKHEHRLKQRDLDMIGQWFEVLISVCACTTSIIIQSYLTS